MATLQLMPVTTINGTTYATAQLILTPASPEKRSTKPILPKQEPSSPSSSDCSLTPPDFLRIGKNKKSENAKRRIHFSKKALTHPRPQSVTRRNARERNRVKAVNQGFVTLANHVPVHLRGKKMSKVDTLRAAILYIQDLQEALQNDTALPLDSCSEEAASPLSLNSSDSLPSSPNSSYQAPDLTRQQMSSTMYYQNDSQYNSYAPNHQQMQAPHACVHPTNHSSYQTSPSQYYHSDYSTPSHIAYNQNGFNFDFTRSRSSSDACPSPSSSCYSSDHDPITPEVEAEILEFASWF